MIESKQNLPWPGADERLVVNSMIRDLYSKDWKECNNFVERCVNAKAKNIPNNLLEDIIQEVMYKILKYLPYFRFQCALKTWLHQIIENHIIDVYRKLQNERPHQPLVVNPPYETDSESQEPDASEVVSAEREFETHDQIRNGIAALLEYANTHSNPTRNRQILRMVLFEEKTYSEVAIAAGCSAPVVGYVVREAQRYAREKMEYKP